jgi:outer membrane biosynthesis protein TonB
LIAARRGDPTPIGGTFGSMDAWPAVNGNIGTINVATPGAQNGALSAHMAFNHCPSGTPTPTPTPTATPITTPTPTATPTPTPTATPSVTPRPTPTPRPIPTPRPRPTPPG